MNTQVLRFCGHVATRDQSGAISINFSVQAAVKLQHQRKAEWQYAQVGLPTMTEDIWREHMQLAPFDASLHDRAIFEPFAVQTGLPPAVVAHYRKAITQATGGDDAELPRVLWYLKSMPCMAVAVAVAQQMIDPATTFVTGKLHFGPWNGGTTHNDVEYATDAWM
jgi:hypothetical protein